MSFGAKFKWQAPCLALTLSCGILEASGSSSQVMLQRLLQMNPTASPQLNLTQTHEDQYLGHLDNIKTLTFTGSKATNFAPQRIHFVESFSNLSGHFAVEVNRFSSSSNILNQGVLSLNNTDNALYQGTISGTGQLIKTGGGDLALTTKIIHGSIKVSSGALVPYGGIQSITMIVEDRATLKMTDSVLKTNIDVYGILDHSFSHLGQSTLVTTVDGNLNLKPKSELVITATKDRPLKLHVKGNINIDSDTILKYSPFSAQNQTFVFLDSEKAMTGIFNQVVAPLGFDVSIQKTGSSYQLSQTVKPLSSFVTGNAAVMANYFDQMRPLQNQFSPYIDQIYQFTTVDQLFDALNAQAPAGLKAAQYALEQTMFMVNDKLVSQVIYEPTKGQRFFVSGIEESAKQDQKQQSYGYRDHTYGALLGYNRGFDSDLTLQLAGAYTYNHVKINHNYGKARIQTGYVNVLFMKKMDWFRILGDVMTGYSFYDTSRNVGTNNLKAHSTHHLVAVKGAAEVQVHWKFNGNNYIEPFDRVSYRWGRESRFTERGAGALNLSVDASFYNTLRNELGLRLGHQISNHDFFVIKAGYVRDERYDNRKYTSYFINTTTPLVTQGIGYNQNYFSASAVFAGDYEKFGWKLQYDALINRYLLDNSGSVEISFKW